MSEEIKDFSLPNPLAISGAILNPLKPPFAQGPGTETVVKVWFLDCKPYSGNEEATRQVAPLPSHPLSGKAKRMERRKE